MKKSLLLGLLSLFGANYAQAQHPQITTSAPIYPAVHITPAMQAAKDAALPPTGIIKNNIGLPTCNTLTPICTAPGAYFNLTTNANAPTAHQLNPTNNYSCLATTPNPIWYYIRVENAGDIFLNLNAPSDIDYSIWGPYPNLNTAQANCGNYLNNVVSCSYSGTNSEFPQILGAQTGQIYVFLITNFANIIQPVTLTQVGGNGSMSCDAFSSINGSVVNDANANCADDAGDSHIPNIYINAGVNGYAISDALGNYSIIADSGSYTVSSIIPLYLSPLITPICDLSHTITFGAAPIDTLGINFYNEVLECPYLTVDISSNQRRRCFNNFTVVEYCNEGFADATNVEVFVEFPQYVNFVSADQPYTIDANGVYVFNIGNLAQGQCGTIHITDSVSCVTGIMGLAQCMRAWVTPANSCVEDADTSGSNAGSWDQSSMMVTGNCVGDSVVRFVIHNTGDPVDGDMEGPSEYRIYVDGALVYTGTFQIAGGDDFIVEVPATGGTIRLEADQRPGHPGNSHPNDVVQGCGDPNNANALANWLSANALPSDDADVTIEEDCMPVLDSYDPNDKQVSPGGVTAQHYILPSTLLDYTIRFQNTGNAMAYRVVVRDTLSADFDLSTLQFGVTSHNCDISLSGTTQPILTFDFKNIYLMDSLTDPAGSQGFLKYKIAPRADLPNGTIVQNRAGIYFDFNEPIITNYAWVTINDQVITGAPIDVNVISGVQGNLPQTTLDIAVYPNPTNGQIFLDLRQAFQQTDIAVFNLNGQMLLQQTIDNQQFTSLDLKDLPAGIYLVKVLTPNQSAVLKVVRQ